MSRLWERGRRAGCWGQVHTGLERVRVQGGSAEAKVISMSLSKMIKPRVAAIGDDEVMQAVP